MGMGVKSRFSSHKAPKNSHLAPGQIKLRTEDLCSIRGELSQIKAQVDSLLESLEHMDQQRNKPAGHAPPGEESHTGLVGQPVGGWNPSQAALFLASQGTPSNENGGKAWPDQPGILPQLWTSCFRMIMRGLAGPGEGGSLKKPRPGLAWGSWVGSPGA
nr:uncharacterized protein LOC131274303 isoform X1 [Dasypus novemcinctus]